MFDRAELTRVYRCHGPMVFRRARRILDNPAEAHEVMQDVFLSLFERPEQYAGGSLTSFLYSSTTHACLNRLRNQRARAKLQHRERAELETSEPARPSQDRLVLLQATLRRMPADLAHVAVYHFMDGLTRDEIAKIMGCSRRHIGNQLARVQRWAIEEASK
jgi:RNA polymerase sigma factor (sigma-70 family)